MSNSLRSIIIQELRARFPDIDWKLGSLVRELVVEPLAKLGDILDSHIKKAESVMDLEGIQNYPAEHKEEIDTWMTRLGLHGFEAKESTGAIAIVSETGEPMTVLAGTVFSWGDDEISLVADTTKLWGGNGEPYNKQGEGVYVAEINVTGLSEQGGSLSSGIPINWVGAPKHVYDIYTKTAITGGRPEQSYQEKADMIVNALSIKSFVGEECISNALQRKFPGEVVDAVVLADKRTRNIGEVTLCVKPFNPPYTTSAPDIIKTDKDGRTYVRVVANSVAKIIDVHDSHNIPCPIVEVRRVEDGNNAVLYAYISGARDGDKAIVYYEGMPIIDTCNKWLQQSVQGLPFIYNVVAPQVVVLSLHIPTNDTISVAAKTAIQSYINAKPLDATVADNEIIALLRDYGITVTGNIIYSTAVDNNTKTQAVSATMGGVSATGDLWSDGRAVALYTYIDKINDNA